MEVTQEEILQSLKENNFQFIGEQNPYVKQVKNLVKHNKPNPEKLFVAEGLWMFKKLVEFGIEIRSLIICPEHLHTKEAFTTLNSLYTSTPHKFAVSPKTMSKMSERDKPDGLLAVAVLPQHNIETYTPSKNSVILVLDGVEIPGNIGTMIRMSDGAGVDAVFICNRKARLSHPKLIKGSMGAILTVPVFEFDDIDACHAWLVKHGFTIYLADTRATHHYYDEPFGTNAAIVMGSERYGISRVWYDYDIVMISIPMFGNVDSLNVGVAATVLAYEASIKNKLSARK